MGRPIKARYFVRSGAKTPMDVLRYKGVTVALATSGTGYSTGATASVSKPDWVDGTIATVSISVAAAAGLISASITNVGEGYLGTPTVTVVAPASQSATAISTAASYTLTNVSGVNGIFPGMLVGTYAGLAAFSHVSTLTANTITLDKAIVTGNGSTASTFTFSDTGSGATFTVGLTSVVTIPGTIQTTAYISTGSSAVNSAIVQQQSARQYLVVNNQGKGNCKLVTTDTLTPGTMKIIATDFGGATYWVKKLTSRKTTLVNRTNTGTALVVKQPTGWTFTAATGTTVLIPKN